MRKFPTEWKRKNYVPNQQPKWKKEKTHGKIGENETATLENADFLMGKDGKIFARHGGVKGNSSINGRRVAILSRLTTTTAQVYEPVMSQFWSTGSPALY